MTMADCAASETYCHVLSFHRIIYLILPNLCTAALLHAAAMAYARCTAASQYVLHYNRTDSACSLAINVTNNYAVISS